MKIFGIFFLLIIIQGCSTHSGPFVTNLSLDGDGNLNVEKCMSEFNFWLNSLSNADCMSSKIKIK